MQTVPPDCAMRSATAGWSQESWRNSSANGSPAGRQPQELAEHPVVADARRRELEQHGAEPGAEGRQRLQEALEELLAARVGRQLADVGQAPVGLGGEAEALGRLGGPAGDGRLGLHPVVGGVDLAGREDGRVVAQEGRCGIPSG